MRALALLMFVGATLPMAFVRPIIGLLLWICFSYMNPHRIAFGFATGFPWVMITALVTMFSMSIHADERQAMPMRPITLLLIGLLTWTGIATLTAVLPDRAQSEWVEFFKILLMAFSTLILVTNKKELHWVIWTIVLSFGFWGFKGGVFTILTGGGYHVLGPIHSFFRDNNQFALVMCMTLPLMRYLQLNQPNKWIRWGLWVLMGTTVVSIAGTYSRGGFLALAAVTFMLVFKSRNRVGLIFVGLVLIALVGAFMPQQWVSRMSTINDYQDQGSAETRIQSWKFATNLAIHHPLTGGGFDVWADRGMWAQYGPEGAHRRAIHSIFFQILGEQGFIGLGLFIALGVTGWFSLRRIKKRSRDAPDLHWMGDLASMLQVSLVGYGMAGALLPMPYFDLFYQILALVVLLQVLASKIVSVPNESRERAKEGRTKQNPSAQQPDKPLIPANLGGRATTGTGLKDLPRW